MFSEIRSFIRVQARTWLVWNMIVALLFIGCLVGISRYEKAQREQVYKKAFLIGYTVGTWSVLNGEISPNATFDDILYKGLQYYLMDKDSMKTDTVSIRRKQP